VYSSKIHALPATSSELCSLN